MNIYQRLNEVRKAVKYLKKDAAVTGYKAVTHDYVTSEVRPHLIKHGIIVVPRQISGELQPTGKSTKQGVPFTNYVGFYEFDFINMDDPEDRFTVSVGAMSEDTADKGPGGAISYAMKYAFLKLLNIETGDAEESRQEQKPNYINEDQQTELADLIKETDTVEAKFLKFLGNKSGVEIKSLSKITQNHYQTALSALMAKKNGNN